METSNVSIMDCGNVQAPMNSNNTQYYPNQLANYLSQEEGFKTCQSFESYNMDMEIPSAHGMDEPLYGDSNSNPLEKFLSGIDQEGFLNHPWFKHNADM